VAGRTGLAGDDLTRTSRLVAKVDSAAVQDGFALYLHGFVVADDGRWVVIQQGMHGQRREARRYHWLSSEVRSFVEEPHTAIDGRPGGDLVNLTDRRAARARAVQLELVEAGPDPTLAALRRVLNAPEPTPTTLPLPHLQLPAHHDVREDDVVMRPADFAELLLTPGLGARTLEALALVAEVIHGAPSRFSDPARFAFALGGKDGHPFPVPLAVYDETLSVLRRAVDRAGLDGEDKLDAMRRLDREARRLERSTEGELSFAALVARERGAAPRYAGRTVRGPARPRPPRRGQLALPGLDGS
jgi:hypothetical protein